MSDLVERVISVPTWSESDQRALDRISKEADHGRRDTFDRLSEHERAVVLAMIRQTRDTKRTPIGGVIWEAEFAFNPVHPQEFLTSPEYLGEYGKTLWDRWMDELIFVLNPQNNVFEWILTGGLGLGKTTVACLAQAYKLYYLTCLRDPQIYFGFMKSSAIVLALFNIWIWKAKDDLFSFFSAMIDNCPFFRENFPPPRKTKQPFNPNPQVKADTVELPKGIKITVGASMQYVLGENVYGGILDEMNFREVRGGKGKSANAYEMGSKAFDLYVNVKDRIETRWTGNNQPGLLCNISSKTTQVSFLEKHIARARQDPHARISDFAVWEVKGICTCPPGRRRTFSINDRPYRPCDRVDRNYPSGRKFRVVVGDKYRSSRILTDGEDVPQGVEILSVPEEHRSAFVRDIETAMMNLAGKSSQPSRPLIPYRDLLTLCIEPSLKHPFTRETVTIDIFSDDMIESFFRPDEVAVNYGNVRGWGPKHHPEALRFVHVDLGETGDSAGIAMVHCATFHPTEIETVGGVQTMLTPQVQVDLMLEIPPPAGGKIDFAKIRRFIFHLRGIGFALRSVTYDGYQGSDSIQEFLKAGIESRVVSVDRNDAPYVALQQAIFHRRLTVYDYGPFVSNLLNLEHDVERRKVDHVEGGHKDVSDAVAAAAFVCTQTVAPDFMWGLASRGSNALDRRHNNRPGEMDISVGSVSRVVPPDPRHKGLTLSDGRPVRRR